VYPEGKSRVSPVEASDKNGSGHDEEEGECSNYSMGANKIVIFWKVSEAIPHS
jgi:hypothetical protein